MIERGGGTPRGGDVQYHADNPSRQPFIKAGSKAHDKAYGTEPEGWPGPCAGLGGGGHTSGFGPPLR